MPVQTERHTGVQDKIDKDALTEMAPNPPREPVKPSIYLASPKGKGRVFTTRKHVGPFFGTESQPHSFSEDEFIRLHPIPKVAVESGQIDPDTYHNALLNRLLTLGAITEDPKAVPMPTPAGPENGFGTDQKNYGIEESTQSVLDAQAANKAIRTRDLIAAKAARNDTTPIGEEVIRERGVTHPLAKPGALPTQNAAK